MAFQTLLKEFYDHQIVVSWTDGFGTEVLGVPLTIPDIRRLLVDLLPLVDG